MSTTAVYYVDVILILGSLSGDYVVFYGDCSCILGFDSACVSISPRQKIELYLYALGGGKTRDRD